jgi:hypothetical protein
MGLGLLVLLSGAAVLGWGAPAGAVGDADLSRLIIPLPVGGWQEEPQSNLDAIVSYLDTLEADSIVPKGGNAVNAVEGWRSPTDHSDYVVVALVALSGGSSDFSSSEATQGAVAALASLCAGVASQSSVHASTVSGVPGSHTLTCTARGGTQPYAAGLAKANVMALVISTATSITDSTMDTIVNHQFAALPSGGFVVPVGGSSGLSTVGEVLLGLVILVLVGGALWWVVQRANQEAVVAPVPGAERRSGKVQRPASMAGGVGPPPNHGVVGPHAAPPPSPTPRPRP